MRSHQFMEGEYYHIYNRGVERRSIFTHDRDRWRFLTLLFILQSDIVPPKISRVVSGVFNQRFDSDIFQEVLSDRQIELISFCLMSNHYHLILSEQKKGRISRFMMRLGDAYTKYFNITHERTGHLFGGVFQSVHIDNNEYLKYLSAYIHMNPVELKRWRGREYDYPWSSFQDYNNVNRWGKFLNPSIILDQFDDQREYENFALETPIKERVLSEYLID